MKRSTIIFIIICSYILLVSGTAAAGGRTGQISLTIGKEQALVGNQPVVLDAVPMIENGRTMVPLRFIGEALGAVVDWDAKSKQITVRQGQENTKLWVGKATAEVNGKIHNLDTPPKVIKGRTLVPLRFISEAFGYLVDYQDKSKMITIKRPNTPPQANFTVDKQFVSVGEAVYYQDLSFDPDGDPIVDRIWMNNNKSFQVPGVYVVSLKVKDSRGKWSEWYNQTIEVSAEPNTKPVAQFLPDNYKVFVDQPIIYTDQSYDPDGDEIVEWNWQNKKESFSQPGIYYVSLQVKDRRGAWSDKCSMMIEVVEKPNEPPVAQFSVERTKVNQGETVIFTNESFDPDGDKLVEFQWTGKQRAYFKEGTYPVSLKVKDSRGKWSEPFTIEIKVTDKVTMTEMEYNLHNPLSGEVVNLTGINPLNFPVIKPAAQSFDQTVLLISNSPETVKENGILYRDTASGSVRLMYHHKNGMDKRKKVYILAENPGAKPAQITITKKGFGGPSQDDLAIGKNGLARYLSSNVNERFNLSPGQVMVLEGAGAAKEISPGHSVFSMLDMNVTEDVTFTFVMVDVGSDVLTTYDDLPVLERDMHQRGTFFGANRTYRLEATGDQPERFSLADNKSDYHLGGVDAITGDLVINKGNYGLVYHLDIKAGKRMGLLTNPRGGLFWGAAVKPDGTVYGLPDNGYGYIKNGSQAVMNMVLNEAEEMEFIFVPPVSSTMPVMFLFMPY
ncbi:MAG: stalk domain-containing protein [Bacillota bacterium]